MRTNLNYDVLFSFLLAGLYRKIISTLKILHGVIKIMNSSMVATLVIICIFKNIVGPGRANDESDDGMLIKERHPSIKG